MSDETDLLGEWVVTFRQWKWRYTFAENNIVTWVDPLNGEGGSGRYYMTGTLFNIIWSKSATKESWRRPIRSEGQDGWIAASYGEGPFSAYQDKKHERGGTSFDYSVGAVPDIRQNGPTCWAASLSMMIAWKKGLPNITIQQALETVGDPYKTMYDHRLPLNQHFFEKYFGGFGGQGIKAKDHLATAAGLKYEPLRSYTARQMYELMSRRRSPLMLEAYWDAEWSHVIVLKRMYGDGSARGTMTVYNDPNAGEINDENFYEIIDKLEGLADRTDVQVWQY